MPDLVVTQNYITTYINAFPDSVSGASNPPSCLARTCTSSHANVVWDDVAQRFEVKTLNLADVCGIYTVTLECKLSNFPAITAAI